MFVDEAKIKVKGGDGGDGCVSFRREKFVPRGGPNGGDGGGGGDVVFIADPGERSLTDFVFNRHFEGKRGEHGQGKDMHGRRSPDRVVKVPPGTLIREVTPEGKVLLADIDSEGTVFIAAKGGAGGRGNARFACNTNRVPREREEGFPGEERILELELKTIADIGLVGFPNAGKSTLLAALSNAKPKIASYPFTTLNPVVGVVDIGQFEHLTVADIPGLIDGAHANVGLGHAFLKHIERAKLLVYVVDTAGVDGRRPEEDLRVLRRELDLYMQGLSSRATLVLANKTDLPAATENLENLREAAEDMEIIPISAATDDNFDELKDKLREKLRSALAKTSKRW